MPDIAASVLAKLKNKAKKEDKSVQLCLQLFAQEEFVRRIEKSDYSDNFILKGGLLIYSLSGYESRSTVDIDFLITHVSNNLDRAEEMLNEIINVQTENDYISFEIVKKEQIALHRKYPGVAFSIAGHIKNVRIPFGVDLGIGDVIVPNGQKRKLQTQLMGFEPPEINTYSLESVVAEKFDAILSMMEFSSRMKDYFDIYYLSQNFEFDTDILATALRETFRNRGRNYSISDFDHVMAFAGNKEMIRKWNAFIKKLKLEYIEFNFVIEHIDKFLRKVFKNS